MGYAVKDWANAYANAPNIPEGDAWPDRWVAPAAAFREAQGTKARLDIAYGPGERETLDLFLPEDAPRGLVVFVHGGFWFRLDKSFFSHLAAGAVGRGWAVAMPSYPLCPTVRVRDITARIGAAIERAAAEVPGPIRLIGHSAGGHLVTRMICVDTPLGRGLGCIKAHGIVDRRPQ
ncbi:MAG: alpha/beta hydrolase, partial [Pseudomonadota bacterium]